MVNVAAERRQLQTLEGFPLEAIRACSAYRGFCELGCVSPDYPYLDVISHEAKSWADDMHYRRTGDVIKAAIRRTRAIPAGHDKSKCLAWILGYASHVVMDVTIHPVINLRVGEYETHQREHRWCEMNQDVHIFARRMNLTLSYAEHLDQGIGRCSGSDGELDTSIHMLWSAALEEVYPDQFAASPPQLNDWHSGFRMVVDGIAESRLLSAISRHVAPGLAFAYPSIEDVDPSFIENLEVPGGGHLHFDAIFDQARQNVHRIWRVVADGALGLTDEFESALGDWNLDTGIDAATNKLVFWDN
jgi:hypothetical protein